MTKEDREKIVGFLSQQPRLKLGKALNDGGYDNSIFALALVTDVDLLVMYNQMNRSPAS